MIKLHLGCGERILPGYVNVDIQRVPGVDVACDLRRLPFSSESVESIYSCANLEHFGRNEWRDILSHWYSVLQPGGVIRVSTADFRAAAERYLEVGDVAELLGLIVGGQKDAHDWHGMIFDFELLEEGLQGAGFRNVCRYDWRQTDLAEMGMDDFSQAYLPHMDKESGRLMMLNVAAEKPK